MNLDQFVNKYDGKGIDWDKSYGNQCVDLYRQYCHEVLQLKQSPGVYGAADIWNTYLKDKFDRIPYTTGFIPNKGDVVIWRGEFGHVAVFIEGTQGSFRSFDLNWPAEGYRDSKGNFIGTGVCHIQGHYYNNVLGVLRPKGVTMSNMYKGLDLSNADSMKPCVDIRQDVMDGKYVKKEVHEDLKEEYKREKSALNTRIAEEKSLNKKLVVDLATKLGPDCQQNVPSIMEQIERALGLEDTVTKQKTEIDKLRADIEKIKKDGTVVVTTPGHSRICGLLSKIGL